MTEKRFTETVSTGDVHDTLTGKSYRCEYRIDDELLELLNELAEENKFLNKKFNIYRDASKRDAREIKELMKDIDELNEENHDLKKANEILMSLCKANNIL